jgi:haloalkane dehalogenase
MATLQLPDGRIHYEDEGAGPAVVLVHGTPTYSYEWRHVIAGLKDSRRLIALDHLGFGESDRPSTENYSPEAHATRFAEFMAHVVPDGKLSLVVHDFGGPIALDWAQDHADRLSHLVVINTWMWPFDDDPVMKKRAAMISGGLGRFLYRYFNFSQRVIMPSAYADKKNLTREIHRQYMLIFPDANSRELVLFALAKSLLGSRPLYQHLWDRRAKLNAVPMTLLWGMKDSAFGPPFLDRWAATFPHAAVVKLERSGHWPHEEQPQEVISELRCVLP